MQAIRAHASDTHAPHAGWRTSRQIGHGTDAEAQVQYVQTYVRLPRMSNQSMRPHTRHRTHSRRAEPHVGSSTPPRECGRPLMTVAGR